MGRYHRHLPLLMAVLIATTALAVGGVAGSDDSPIRVGVDSPINSDANVEQYESDGVASADLADPQMSVTIGEERGDVGLPLTLDALDGSTRNDFIRIEHKEGLSRTVQIPIREDYWKPFPREGLESLNGDHTADLNPVSVDGADYTLITVTFEGEGAAVFPIPKDAVAAYRAVEKTENRTNSTFGIDLGLTKSPWSYVDSGVLAGNDTTVRIEGDTETMMIQYNDGTAEEPVWLNVPDGDRRGKPVYTMQKDGVDGAVYVVSTTSDPPELRYKEKSTLGDRVSASIRDARTLPDRILRGVGSDRDIPFFTLTPLSVSRFAGGGF